MSLAGPRRDVPWTVECYVGVSNIGWIDEFCHLEIRSIIVFSSDLLCVSPASSSLPAGIFCGVASFSALAWGKTGLPLRKNSGGPVWGW